MKQILFTALATVFLTSCSSDDSTDAPLGSYDNGVLVLNEGGLGTITFLSNDLSTLQQDVFTVVNGTTQNLGQFTQSIFFDGDRAFIISNGSNKITVVNRYTFEYIATISEGFNVPRYGAVVNGKAYVTNSKLYNNATDDYLTVIDLSTLSVEAPIAMNDYAEKIIAVNDKLYVAGGYYGSGSKINVVNTNTNTLEPSIEVGVAPNSLEANNGTLYVLCGSWTLNSQLVKVQLSNHQVSTPIVFPDTMGNAANLDLENEFVYFTASDRIYKFALGTTVVTDTPLVDLETSAPYIGYGFAVNDGRIFISEAASDFSSDGKAYIYDTNGDFLEEFQTGLGPNGFYFN